MNILCVIDSQIFDKRGALLLSVLPLKMYAFQIVQKEVILLVQLMNILCVIDSQIFDKRDALISHYLFFENVSDMGFSPF